jgi:hypothetical protein
MSPVQACPQPAEAEMRASKGGRVLTHIDQSPIYFAVLHNAVSEPDDVVGFGPRLEGSL